LTIAVYIHIVDIMNQLSIDQISIRHRSLPLAAARSISRETSTRAELIEVSVRGAGVCGVGQAGPTPHWGESVDQALADFAAIEPRLRRLTSRDALQVALPAGALRNAIDCALWDLEAKQAGQTVEVIAGVTIRPVTTVFTIPLDTPQVMGRQAEREHDRPEPDPCSGWSPHRHFGDPASGGPGGRL